MVDQGPRCEGLVLRFANTLRVQGSLGEDVFHPAHDSAYQAHFDSMGMEGRTGENILLLLFFISLALVTNVN